MPIDRAQSMAREDRDDSGAGIENRGGSAMTREVAIMDNVSLEMVL
jgi:hypothetical protein